MRLHSEIRCPLCMNSLSLPDLLHCCCPWRGLPARASDGGGVEMAPDTGHWCREGSRFTTSNVETDCGVSSCDRWTSRVLQTSGVRECCCRWGSYDSSDRVYWSLRSLCNNNTTHGLISVVALFTTCGPKKTHNWHLLYYSCSVVETTRQHSHQSLRKVV